MIEEILSKISRNFIINKSSEKYEMVQERSNSRKLWQKNDPEIEDRRKLP